jgi:small-conductance mechanosensitive channel
MCDLLKSVKERFDREGIEIPFPYRTIVYKKDLDPETVGQK